MLKESIDTSYFLKDVWPQFERYVFFYLHNEVEQTPARSEVMKRGAQIFQHLSTYLSKLVAKHIRQRYGGVFYAGKHAYTAEQLGIRLLLKSQDKIDGEYDKYSIIRVRIPRTYFSKLISKMAQYLYDEEVSIRVYVKRFCHEIFEVINHEIVHMEQEIRFSKHDTIPNPTHKTLISHKADFDHYPDEAKPEAYMKYLGLTNEIEAFAVSAAAKMVKEATRGIDPSDKKAWNGAVDQAINQLRKAKDPENRSSLFLSCYHIIKQRLKQAQANVKEHEIEAVWKRFISKAYIQMQQLKV